MEPQIIDYYSELPFNVNIIDKMNEELYELQKKYDELQKKIKKFKPPYIVVKTLEEYKQYYDIICNQFERKIKMYINHR